MTLVIGLITYYSHMILVMFYTHQCRQTLFQVLFLKNSTFCCLLKSAISMIEHGYLDAFSNILSILSK